MSRLDYCHWLFDAKFINNIVIGISMNIDACRCRDCFPLFYLRRMMHNRLDQHLATHAYRRCPRPTRLNDVMTREDLALDVIQREEKQYYQHHDIKCLYAS